MALPKLEEGSALVTYEAMGVGLPLLTSPVGAGSVVRHDKEGLVVDPHSEEHLIAALRRMAYDADLRRTFGEAGRARARSSESMPADAGHGAPRQEKVSPERDLLTLSRS